MKIIKILLSDPRHSTVGSHSNFIPINIGYIASYIKNELKDFDVKINLTTDKERAFNRYLMHHGMEKGSGLLERKFLKVLQ